MLKVKLIDLDIDNPKHVDLMFRVRTHALVTSCLQGTPPSSFVQHVSYLQNVRNKKFFLISVEDHLAGYCQSTYLEDEIELGWALHPEYWGKGIGSSSVELLVDLMLVHKKTITLYVKKENVRALALYKKHRFQVVELLENDLYKMVHV